MKSINLVIKFIFTTQLLSQSFNYEQFRKFMDDEMNALGNDESPRKYIIGTNGKQKEINLFNSETIGYKNFMKTIPKVPPGQAYCMDGQQLPNFLGLSLPVGTYNTYEKLIALAKKDYNYMIIQTNARYGY